MGDPSERPIGVFDSGVGGLTVLASIAELLPRENLLYLGDTARVPYGTKSAATVTVYSLEIARFFMEREVKAIVVACNTASAMALPHLRESFSVPMVGVVSPGAGAAVRATRNGRVGVIDGAIEIFTQACPLFVPLAEEGWVDNEITRAVVARYLAPLRDQEIDTLLLGCTHYPLLAPMIRDFLGPQVTVVDSAEATAQALHQALEAEGLLGLSAAGKATFCVTDVPDRFIQLGSRFYGNSVEAARRIELRPSAGFAANHTSG